MARAKAVRHTVEDRGYQTPCWIWALRLDDAGYGRVTHAGHRGRLAHEVAWESQNGPVPDGLILDHRCKQRACVRPAHLEAVVQAVNVRRGNSARLSGADVEQIRRATDTRAQIADRFGISMAYVSRIRSGKARMLPWGVEA